MNSFFTILEHLAVAQTFASRSRPENSWLIWRPSPDLFKIIVTSQTPRFRSRRRVELFLRRLPRGLCRVNRGSREWLSHPTVRECASTMLRGRETRRISQAIAWLVSPISAQPAVAAVPKTPIAFGFQKSCCRQTRVAAAIPYYERFFTAIPGCSLARHRARGRKCCACGPVSAITAVRAICKKTAQQIVAKHGGQFPSWLEDAHRFARHRKTIRARGNSEHCVRCKTGRS